MGGVGGPLGGELAQHGCLGEGGWVVLFGGGLGSSCKVACPHGRVTLLDVAVTGQSKLPTS